MKIRITLSIVLFSVLLIQAQDKLIWTDPIDIAPKTFGNDYPRVVDNNGNPVVTWGGNDRVWFSRLNGSVFTDPIQVNNDTTNAFVASWTGPDLDCRNDTIYACFMHRDWGRKSYVVRSYDGGQSFSAPLLVENYPDSASRFPTVTIDQKGNPLVAIMKMDLNGRHPHYVVRKSYDQGDSFVEEENVGGWSGQDSEACDCCPASIKATEENVAVLYRDNLDNIRDIYATVSTDYGETFDNGFAVDDNFWQIFSCPSSGPDGVIIGDTIYSVFFSRKYCYLSRSSISEGELISMNKLGALSQNGTQNFPRIDNYGNQVAITWREFANGNKIFIAYSNDITSGKTFLYDTVYFQTCSTADVAIGESGIHVVVEDLSDGTVKYMKGSLLTSGNTNVEIEDAGIYPNPASNRLMLEDHDRYEFFEIFTSDGRCIMSGNSRNVIDISSLNSAFYLIALHTEEKTIKKIFLKK
jgi:hypothetical protein